MDTQETQTQPYRSPDVARALAAIEEWEAMGAPINVGALQVGGYETDADRPAYEQAAANRTRAAYRAWAANPVDTGAIRLLTAAVLGHVGWALSERAGQSRKAEMAKQATIEAGRRAALIDQLRADKEGLGLTNAEAEVLLDLRPGAFANMLKTGGSYALARMEKMATTLRAHSKVAAR